MLQSPHERPAGWKWPAFMAFMRLPMVMAAGGITILAYRWAGQSVGVDAGLAWSPLTLTVINILCLVLLLWRGRAEGISMLELIGFQRQVWLRDLMLGIVWCVALGAALMAGVSCVVIALHPTAGTAAFEKSFVGDADFSIQLPLWLAVLSAIVFPLVNAPVEELQYRGYAQPGLIAASGRPAIGIVVSAVGFGLQHIGFAMTPTAAVAYAVGFFLWGLGAGLIAYRQQRLAPLIVAHFLSNISFGILPLVFILGA